MERSIYCSLSELQTLFENSGSNDWRHTILKELNSIFAYTDNESFCQNASSMDEDAFIAAYDGTTPMAGNSFAKKQYLDVWLQGNLKPVKSIKGLFPDKLINGVVCRSVDPGLGDLANAGIETIDDINDKWASNLRTHWYEELFKGDPFSWNDFLRGKVPTSSSMVIIDRFLFKVALFGAENVKSILKSIIPSGFTGEYTVSLIFEYSPSTKWKEGEPEIPMRKAIQKVNSIILTSLNIKKINIEYIAIEKPPTGRMSYSAMPGDKSWRDLYNFTHDRKILTNYYQIISTHGFSAVYNTCENGYYTPRANSFQRVIFETLLSEIDNPQQRSISRSIPFYTIPRQLHYLSDALLNAPVDRIHCYKHVTGDWKLSPSCSLCSIHNPLLEIH